MSSAGSPTGLAIDGDGNLYSASWGGTVKKYSSAGVLLNGTIGSGLLGQPYGLDLDSAGNLFVASYGNGKVYVFTPQGARITDWAVTTPLWVATSAVPEPAGLGVAIGGILMLAGVYRRRRRDASSAERSSPAAAARSPHSAR